MTSRLASCSQRPQSSLLHHLGKAAVVALIGIVQLLCLARICCAEHLERSSAVSHNGVSNAAVQFPEAHLRGDSLKQVLRPLPPREPADALRSLEVLPGFSVEFVAHEPAVTDPVAATIDENGLLYVAEDVDYPYRPAEGEKPKGRVRVLKDRDGDGFYEESHIFAEGLLWPAGVTPWKGGVFVAAPPDIWYMKDTNGDGKADIRLKVFTGFGTDGSQYILNNLVWGMDHKIYAAVAGNGGLIQRVDRPTKNPVSVSRKDFRFDPVNLDFESISGGEQFGNTFDDWGNRFLCSQDTPVYQVVFPLAYLQRNPLISLSDNVRRLLPSGAPIFRTSPVEGWRAIRSSRRLLAHRGSPDASGVSHNVLDGVAGSTVYRGSAFPPSFYGNLFAGDAQNNLVHRRSLVADGIMFRSDRLDQGTEFLRSDDNWFRPVNFVNAPDGTLLVLDLAREVLEAVHIPMDVVSHLDLTSGRDRGRIYRVYPTGFRRQPPPHLGTYSTAELVACLENPNGWWRDTAHRLLYERQDKLAEAALRQLLIHSPRPESRLLALWSLQGLNVLSDSDILAGLSDKAAPVRENAIQLAEPRLKQSRKILNRCLEMASDSNSRVRFQLAFSLGESSDSRAIAALAVIAQHDPSDELIRTAILSSIYPHAVQLADTLLHNPHFTEDPSGVTLIEELARIVGARNRVEEIQDLVSGALDLVNMGIQQTVVIGLSEGEKVSGQESRSWIRCLGPKQQRQLDGLVTEAKNRLQGKDVDLQEIQRALQVLEVAPGDAGTPVVLGLLDRFPPEPVQVAAIRTLFQLGAKGIEESLVSRWRVLSPQGRRAVLSSLIRKKEGVAVLLGAVESQRILPGEVDAVTRAALSRQTDPDLHDRVTALWGEEKAGTRKEVIQQFRRALELTGNPAAGQTSFQRLCSTCHRLNEIGNEIGPNLALAASRSPEELLVNILDPNLEVNPAYVQYIVETTDGESCSGLLTADQPASVTLKGVNLLRTFPRSQIKKISSTGQSLMPVGLEQGLTPQDFADLLSFLIEFQYDPGTSGRSYQDDRPEERR